MLADSEILHYADTCGTITAQPLPVVTTSGSNAVYTISTSIAPPNYQWQQDAGLGFVNLTNSGPYSGVNTPTLTITAVTTTMNNNHYRCVVYNDANCADTSGGQLLTVMSNSGVQHAVTMENIQVVPNPGHDFILFQFPLIAEKCEVQLLSDVGQVVAQGVAYKNDRLRMDIKALPPGVYIAKIRCDDDLHYRRIVKE